jgi:hypothetical protein
MTYDFKPKLFDLRYYYTDNYHFYSMTTKILSHFNMLQLVLYKKNKPSSKLYRHL